MNKLIAIAMVFAVTALLTTQGVAALGSNPGVTVTLNPSRQSSSDGSAVYKVTVQDLHEKGGLYVYDLSFVSETSIGSFFFKKTETVTLGAGESKTFILTVKTYRKGFNFFKVVAAGQNTPFKDVATGILIFKAKPLFKTKLFSFNKPKLFSFQKF